MSATADKGIIKTARIRRSYLHPTNLDQMPLKPPASERVILRFSTIFPAADGGHGRRRSHLNRHEQRSPWIPKSSGSDHPETGKITLFHQTLTHFSSLKITAA